MLTSTLTIRSQPTRKKQGMNTLLICSGGLDSVTLAYQLHSQNKLATLLTFFYGQKHKKEITYAKTCADRLAVPHHLLDIASLQTALAGSALTDANVDVPDGFYKTNTLSSTIVPNRNPIMLTIAYALAVQLGCDAVALAVHAGDHPVYPDCTPQFLDAFAGMQTHALSGVATINLHAPFSTLDKADIVRLGQQLGVPFCDTWSCYKGQAKHCGTCPTCLERQSAFATAKVVDPTDYET